MSFKEIDIPEHVRSYREYPQIIENEGCPRCNSLMLKVDIQSFKIGDLKFGCTCSNCGLFFYVKEDNVRRKLIFEYEA
ncbi:MAG: hypothetical protein ACTSO9_07585 [Candidatus Helarchaeota archaeon]